MHEKLKEDFPIEWEDDHFVTRREFFKFLTLASGGVAAGTAAIAAYSLIPREEIKFEPALICSMSDLKPGSALAFSYPRPSDLCILVHTKSGDIAAFKRRCTHLSCPVEYEVKKGIEMLYCPCHNGAFSLKDGSVLQGPPPHPLPQIKIEQRDGEVWATGVFSGGHA
jgi:Rieske Fe-S protein